MFRFQGIRRLVNLRRANEQQERVFTVETSGLTQQQVAAGIQALKALDLMGKSNHLSSEELIKFLYTIGMNPTPDVVSTKLRCLKLHHKQDYTWGELAHLWQSLEKDKGHEEEILERAFQFFDKDGNGEISVAELRTTMSELGGLLTEEEIMEFVGITDANNDGVIAYHEFLEILKSQAPVIKSGERPSLDEVVAGTTSPSKSPNTASQPYHASPDPHTTPSGRPAAQQQAAVRQNADHSNDNNQLDLTMHLLNGGPGGKSSNHATPREGPWDGLPGQLQESRHTPTQTRAPSALDVREEGQEGGIASRDSMVGAAGVEGAAGVAGGAAQQQLLVESPLTGSPRPKGNRLRPQPPHDGSHAA